MRKDISELSDEAVEVIHMFEDMEDAQGYMPDNGLEFYESVMDKAASIVESAWTDHLTPRQVDAMRNMHAGVQRWIR